MCSSSAALKIAQKLEPMRNAKMDMIIERLGDSKEFWDLIAGYGALVLNEDFPGEKILSREDFCADLTAELQHASECVDEELEESARIEREGGDREL